jgi:hypothetical protein
MKYGDFDVHQMIDQQATSIIGGRALATSLVR